MATAQPSARKASTSYAEAIKPALTLSALISIAYAAYLHLSGTYLEFQADTLESMFVLLPEGARQTILEGGVQGTLVAIGSLIIRSLLVAVACLFAGRWIFGKFLEGRAAPTETAKINSAVKEKTLLTVPLDDYEIIVITPETKKYGPAKVHRRLFPEVYMRLDRAPLTLKQKSTPLAELQLAAHQILKKHAAWTCDPAGHHADVGLYDHSVMVAKKMRELSDHRLAYTIGLLHDIGKLIAYRQKKDKKGNVVWEVRSTRHDRLSADIVRKLPEYQALSEGDRQIINDVLTYCHNRHQIPEGTSEEVIDLVQKLCVADGLGIEADKRRAVQKASNEDVINEVANALWQVIPSLNINAYKDGNADGWTMEVGDYVAILESAMRRELGNYLTPQRAHELQINIDKTKIHDHPATRVIVNALRQMGLLIEDHNGIPAFEGLFDAKVGSRTFVGVALARKDNLEALDKKVIERWGDCNYSLKIREAKAGKAGAAAEQRQSGDD